MAAHLAQHQHRSRGFSVSDPQHSFPDEQSIKRQLNLLPPPLSKLTPLPSSNLPQTSISNPPIEKSTLLAVPQLKSLPLPVSKRTRSRSFSACFESNLPRASSHLPAALNKDFRVPEIVTPLPIEASDSTSSMPNGGALQAPTSSPGNMTPTKMSRSITFADSVASMSCDKNRMALFRSPIFLAYLARLSLAPPLEDEEAKATVKRIKQLQEDLETTNSLEEIRRLLIKGDHDLEHSRPSSRCSTSGKSTPVSPYGCDGKGQVTPFGINIGKTSTTNHPPSSGQHEATRYGSRKNVTSQKQETVRPTPTSGTTTQGYHSLPIKSETHIIPGQKPGPVDTHSMSKEQSSPKSATTPGLPRSRSFLCMDRDLNAVVPSSF